MIAIRQPIGAGYSSGYQIHLEKDVQAVVSKITSQDCEIYKVEDDLNKKSCEEIKATLDKMKEDGQYRTVREF